MIPYKIIFWKRAEADFLKLPIETQIRISEKLKIIQINPFIHFIRLKGRKDYKLRIEDYRVIADIDQTERKIELTKIGNRRDVYKR